MFGGGAGTLTYSTLLDSSGISKGLNQIEGKVRGSGSTIKGIVASLGIAKVVSMAMNQITNSIGDAVSRVDTLNNFPKVMSNLGIGSKDAQKSIDKLSDKLSGLPTTLDDASLSVQRFTSANGDIDKSTDYFLALNNALLAGGASADIQSSAMEQLSQAYAKGKPDMMEWRSLQTAMPAQLKQVADAMGYTTSELGEALRNGDVSMDDFMDTLVKLNTEGVNGFQSFEEQAKNSTGGIGTSITVAKTQIVKGVADIIKSLDEGLKQQGTSISDIITKVGKKAKEILDLVAKNIPKAINFIVKVVKVLSKIAPYLTPIIAGIVAYVGVMKTAQAITMAVRTAQLLLNAAMSLNPVGLIIAAIVGLIAVFVLLWKKCDWFREFWINLWNKIVDVLKHPVEYIGYFVGLIIGFYVKIYTALWNFATKTLPNIIKNIINWFKQLPQNVVNVANAIVNAFKNLPSKMLSIGKDIVKGIWNGIKSAKTWIEGKIKEFASGLVKGVKDSLKIKSPSRVFAQEVGQWIPKGIAVGIDANSDSVLKSINDINDEILSDMNRAVNMSAGELRTNASVSSNFANNSMVMVQAQFTGNVELDGQKAGRILTPVITKTIKNGGGI